MKVPLVVPGAVAVLTLLTWLFFYFVTPSAPLGTAATTVVAAFYLFLVLAIHWLWSKFRRKDGISK